VVGVPYFVLFIHYRGKSPHIQIATDRERLLDPAQSTSTDIFHVKPFGDVGKTVGAVVGGGVKRDFVAAPGERPSQAHRLPLNAAFDQQLVDDECDVH